MREWDTDCKGLWALKKELFKDIYHFSLNFCSSESSGLIVQRGAQYDDRDRQVDHQGSVDRLLVFFVSTRHED